MADKEKKVKKRIKPKIKIIIILILIILYSFFIGTKGIFIKEYKITSKNITNEMHGLKILHFSDLHYTSSVKKNDIKNVVKKINQAKPDIVIFTGDLLNNKHKITNDEKEFLTSELKKVKTEYGKYYVSGETDSKDSISILNMAGFTNLENMEQTIYVGTNESILLIDKTKSKKYFETDNNNGFKILAIHNPNDFDKYKEYDFDLALAGHTHNGQINIPKIKDLFINGKYTKTYQKVKKTKLFISPGIGTSKIHVRMFNHPTILLYRLNKTSK